MKESSVRRTTDHVAIRQWVEKRGGLPVIRRRADGRGSSLLIVFPHREDPESVRPIDWKSFFDEFERERLEFCHEEECEGRLSYSNQLVERKS
jgi:hypothetical protein